MTGAGAMDQRREWIERLRRAAGPALRGTPVESTLRSAGPVDAVLADARTAPNKTSPSDAIAFIETFRDEAGNRRAVDRPLLMTLLGLRSMHERGVVSPDVDLWWHLAEGRAWTGAPWLAEQGPLVRVSVDDSIEEWTERQLCVLHALRSIASRDGDAALRERCADAARWCISEIQPDNATHHPWAIHVFVELWLDHDQVEARLYAETMLHNCLVGQGRAERFSACILAHAAGELSRLSRSASR
jgi:hypothetical protein